jgi:hypothetical protein
VNVGVVPDSEENEAACLCWDCPSKNEEGMRLYCVRGKSAVAVDRGFCACSWCPLWSGYGLTEHFYCDAGDAAAEDGGGLSGGEEVT